MTSGPTDLRATFELFRFYRPEVGIERLLEDCGAAKMSVRQIYHAVHNRPPDSLSEALNLEKYDSIAIFVAALSSGEFQEHLAANILRCFPEKRRMFFVHIPKTGGVDLATHLISRYPSISTTLLDPILTPQPEQLFLAIKHIVLELAVSDTIFVSGHTHLGAYQNWNGNGIRFNDQVFTVVREPMDQLISQINYTLTRIFSAEHPTPADTAGWRREFSVRTTDTPPSKSDIVNLARCILRHPGVVVPNVVCSFLGGGSCEQSIVQTVVHDLEVVQLERLDAWSEQRWKVGSARKLNSSKKFVSLSDFSADDLSYMRSIIEEDAQYYEYLQVAYQHCGGTSVRGAQILGH